MAEHDPTPVHRARSTPMARRWRRAGLASVAAGALALAACGDDDGGDSADTAADTATDMTTASSGATATTAPGDITAAPATTTGDTATAATTGDTATSDTATSDTTTDGTATDGSTDGTATGGLFEGESGWTLEVPAGWVDISDNPAAGTAEAAWATGGGVTGFGSNVNVVFESTPDSIDLQTYLDASLGNLGDLELGDSGVSTRDDGTEYGFVELSLTQDGLDLQSYAEFVRVDGGFATATFVAPAEVFDAELAEVQPAISTLSAA